MALNAGLFSSATDNWATPLPLFQHFDAQFNFELDVCASKDNAKCAKYFTAEIDALTQTWTGVCWMNPPYGRQIGKWVAKAYRSAHENEATVVCLLPARTDTAWWHDYCMRGRIILLRGRVKFGDGRAPAPFPSAVVIFSPAGVFSVTTMKVNAL
jgi:phage N-6-adenine-methyltransferase